MPEPLTVSLQPWPKPDKEKDSIGYLIQRINAQKGSFRNVSEQSLEEEIRLEKADKVVDEDEMEVEETTEEVADGESTREDLYKARAQIDQQLAQAKNECGMALDFVSALLMKYAPGPANLTLSAFLKENIPSGSFGAEVVQAPKPSDADIHNQDMVSIGWRMQSLNGAADSLLKSATRLETEIEKETRYWSQVLAVKDQGWSLCRLPREKHTLGVQYGFAEAHAEFRDRGLAALRRDPDGSLTLDRGLRSHGNHTLRVRILQQGETIAASMGNTTGGSEDDPVEKQILQARNSIFDEELHRELHREARNLLNQGVHCIGDAILLPFEGDKQIEIDLVSTEDGSETTQLGPIITSDAILLSLRILLLHAHRQNLHHRSQIPAPLQEKPKPRPIYAILKPLVEYLQHKSNLDSMSAFYASVRGTLRAAGLGPPISEPDSSITKTKSSLEDSLANLSIIEPPLIETLMHKLTSPLESTLRFIASESLTLTLDIHTDILAPTHGTTYRISTTSSDTIHPLASIPQDMPFSALPALQKHIVHLIKLDIIHGCKNWKASSPHSSTMLRTKNGERDSITIDVAPKRLFVGWQRTGFLGQGETFVWEEGMKNQGQGFFEDIILDIEEK